MSVVNALRDDYISDLCNFMKTESEGSFPEQVEIQAVRSAGARKSDACSDVVEGSKNLIVKPSKMKTAAYILAKKRIAAKLQRYLILAFFSVVPDRQRTIRELSLGTTFQREGHIVNANRKGDSKNVGEESQTNGHWVIKHGPDDYKTGKSYGARPPLVIAGELTTLIGTGSSINIKLCFFLSLILDII